MVDCNKIWINRELHYKLQDNVNPCDNTLFGPLQLIGRGKYGKVYKASINVKVPNLLEKYIVKIQPVSPVGVRETHVLQTISTDLLTGVAPLLFPFLYTNFTCKNEMYTIMQPANVSLNTVLKKYAPSLEWWVNFLYQLSKAVYYLEDRQMNHNDLTFENVMFQYISRNYKDFAIMIIDFGSTVVGHTSYGTLPPFVLGRDLNYFLYTLIYGGLLPETLAEQLLPLLAWENLQPFRNEDQYIYGLRRANLNYHNWKTSGKNVSRWLAERFPTVTDKCSLERLNKLYGVALGSLVISKSAIGLNFCKTILDNNNVVVASAVAQNNWTNEASDHILRAWPVAILHQFDTSVAVIESTLKASTSNEKDVVWATVFVALLIHELINGVELDKSINNSLQKIMPNASPELRKAIKRKSVLLTQDTVTAVITNVLWALRNNNSYSDTVSVNNNAIVGAIAGAKYGVGEIPKEWIDDFDRKNCYTWGEQQLKSTVVIEIVNELTSC